jgi:hypothetical protein
MNFRRLLTALAHGASVVVALEAPHLATPTGDY